jgi:hypothetical protein
MQRVDFESLLFIDVEERAGAEPAPQPGHPKYHGRPWTRLRDEMVATGSRTVAELPPSKVRLSYRSTRSGDEGGTKFLRRLFGGD